MIDLTKGNPKGEVIKLEELEVTLTDQEKKALADEAAKLQQELEPLLAERKTLNGKVKERKDRIAECLEAYEAGVETKEDVRVTKVIDEKRNVVQIYARGQVEKEFPIGDEDRQLAIPETKKADAGDDGKATKSKSEEIADVRKSESSKRTKLSAVDGGARA